MTLDLWDDWAHWLDCPRSGPGLDEPGCTAPPNPDGPLGMYWYNKPHTLSVLAMAQQASPSLGLCSALVAAMDDPDLRTLWSDNIANDSGWWKGGSQMMQGMVFAVGGYDLCTTP